MAREERDTAACDGAPSTTSEATALRGATDALRALIVAADPAVVAALADGLRAPHGGAAEVADVATPEAAARLLAEAEHDGRPFAALCLVWRGPVDGACVAALDRLRASAPGARQVLCAAGFDGADDALAGREDLLLLRVPCSRAEAAQIGAALRVRRRAEEEARRRAAELEFVVRSDRERLDLLETAVDARTRELRRSAMTDRLTGLPNRALLNDRLSQAVADARRDPRRKFALLFLDFDRFKVVNDGLGHETGDLLLVAVAERITSVIRSGDFVARGAGTAARLGGDEFVVLLTDLDDCETAYVVARRLLEALEPPYRIRGRRITCTASFGVTTSDCGYERAEDVVRDADTAMYRAKAAGRARIMRFDPLMHEEAVARLTLETALRAALDDDALETHLQPIVRVADGSLSGFEVLARWRHATRGWIPPGEFIPVAEETGLIVPLGEAIMRKSFRVASDWRRRFGDGAPYLTVNLSPKQLSEPDLLKRIDAALGETGAFPRDVQFEVTETYLMSDTEGAVATLRRLRERGFGLLIDDFGTGYSSLSTLHRFPFTGMKIDRSFLANSECVRNYAAVLVAMTTLAHDLGLVVVAEGVENARQIALLESVRCDRAQGFFYGRPMPPESAERLVAESFEGAVGPAAAPR